MGSLLIVCFWRRDADGGSISRQKKVYFRDPPLQSHRLARSPGLPFDVPAAVENALALCCRYEPPARPVVMATEDELDLHEDDALVPAHLRLWAIG